MERPNEEVKTQQVIGVTVKNPAKETLGEIFEIVLDKNDGVVTYVAVESDSFLGLNSKLFAIPWKALNYDKDHECFILDMDKERLNNLPSFDKDNWPDMTKEPWTESLKKFFSPKSS